MKQYIVTGMTCAACQSRVEKAVSMLPDVNSVNVSLLTNSMGVEGDVSDSDIISAVEAAGYGAKVKGQEAASKTTASQKLAAEEEALKDHETPKLVRRLIWSVGFLIVLMYITMGHNMLDWPLPDFLVHNHVGLALTQMLLAIIVMFINRAFFISGFCSLWHRGPNMDSLVALGSAVSFAWSLYIFYRLTVMVTNGDASADVMEIYHNQLYFESAAMIPALITVGKTLESLSKGRTTDALKNLMKIAPKTAVVERDGQQVAIDIDEVRIDDIFIVKPGESIPVDGIIIEGDTAVDESALTGESIPTDKCIGDTVSAATINQTGYIKARATRVGEDTTFANIIQMVSDAAATKAPIARIADRVSGVFVPVVIGIAFIVFIIWMIVGVGSAASLERAITVLVISCPCALGLATPVAIMVGNGMGAKNGILFKTSETLENTGRVQIVALDKTGTITVGKPEVTDVIPAPGVTAEELLEVAYQLEVRSEHPLARAIVSHYEEGAGSEDVALISLATTDGSSPATNDGTTPATNTQTGSLTNDANLTLTNWRALPGNGIEAELDGDKLYAGSEQFIRSVLAVDNTFTTQGERLADQGKTPLYFAHGNKILGIIAVADVIKEDSREAIKQLKNMGIATVMLTGDNQRTANAIADDAGVDYVIAGVLPDGKEAVIRHLQEQGKVAMVGDGINDAPALTRADIGIAIGASADVAIDSADIVLMNSRLSDVAAAIRMSRATLRNIHENLFWAFAYNVILIPMAAGVFPSIQMNPMWGAAAMALSSFTVCMNALRLNLFKLHSTKRDHVIKNRVELSQEILELDNKEDSDMIINVEGMMCQHCEARVKEAVEGIDGVVSAEASHDDNNVKVTLDGDVSEETFKEVVEGVGYKFLGVE